MRNKFSKTIFTFIAISVFALACNDDFVKISPEYSIDSENYFNSEEDYYNALVATYDILQSTYINVIVGEIASDNTLCGGENANDVLEWQQIDDMIHTPVNNGLRNIWNWMFAGVQRANYFMEFKDNMDFEGKNAMVGEVRFLRAYYYFELVKWFGGVPLKTDERFKLGDETSVPRASVAEVYKAIEDDLKAAIEVLPVAQGQVGRVTKGAAQALLGKAYLYQEKFADAATVLEDVITAGNYALVDDYNTIFEHDGENNIESVFEVQYNDAEGASFDCLQCSEGNVAVGFRGIREYEGPMFTSGFSFDVPTKEAYDAFSPNDFRRDVAILDIAAWAADNADVKYSLNYNEQTGYFNRKYIPRKRRTEAPGDRNINNPNNYRAIRYADVLLMAAEAYNRGGIDDAKAREYVSEVRRRAFFDENQANISDAVSGSDLTDAIWNERRLELMGEGHRFFDLVRTGKAAGVIPDFVAGKHELFPIPKEEIEFSNGLWAQNPGY